MSIENDSAAPDDPRERAALALFGLCYALASGDGKAARKACLEGSGWLAAAGLPGPARRAADCAPAIRIREAMSS